MQRTSRLAAINIFRLCVFSSRSSCVRSAMTCVCDSLRRAEQRLQSDLDQLSNTLAEPLLCISAAEKVAAGSARLGAVERLC